MDSSQFCRRSCIEIKDYLDSTSQSEIRKDVFNSLTAKQKFIPSKYFYDASGSQLFEEICLLSEYYLTRAEMGILQESASDIMKPFRGGDLIELGSGANWKIRLLLDAVEMTNGGSTRYVPVDISRTALISASEELLEMYPKLKVLGIVADFIYHMEVIPNHRPKLIIFFGSTIGNLSKEDRRTFLKGVTDSMKEDDWFLIGLDMLKPIEILEAAYNDSQGITAKFNRNILSVVNKELKADFSKSDFDHLAFFNREEERVEMHLQANRDMHVKLNEIDLTVEIKKGETIHTENCYKFSREKAEDIFSEAKLKVTDWFMDDRERFSLVKLTRA